MRHAIICRVPVAAVLAALAIALMSALSTAPLAPAHAQNFNAYQTYAYVFTCNGQRFERYISARSQNEAIARMSWLDQRPCRVESFSVEGGTGRNLWPGIRQQLEEARRAREQAGQQQR